MDVQTKPPYEPQTMPFPKPRLVQRQPQPRQSIFTLTHGDLVLSYPANITVDDVSDIKDYFALVFRLMDRASYDPTTFENGGGI